MKDPIDDGYRLLAAGCFRKQAKQLADQLDGVRQAEDIEYVHRARVASRRLRAMIKLLGDWVPAKQIKRWRKEIRLVTLGLGDARDKDVQIDFLCKAISSVEDPVCCPGIAHLLMHLEYQREMVQPKVVEAVERLRASGVLEQMRESADQVYAELGKSKEMIRTPGVVAHCTKHVLRRLDRFLADQACLARPDQQDRHHEMRIAAKRLRYTLEIARPVYAGRVDEIITHVKRVQTLLGEIHDCDVWVAHLDAFLDEERRRMVACFGNSRPFARVKIGLEYLQQNRRSARRAVFDELSDFWQALRSQRVWERLTTAVQTDAADRAEHGEKASELAPGDVPRAAKCAGNGHGATTEQGDDIPSSPRVIGTSEAIAREAASRRIEQELQRQ